MINYPIPPGWKLVPIEATDDGVASMANKGAMTLKGHPDTPPMHNRTEIVKAVYRAMIAAAPEPPRLNHEGR